MANFFDPSWLAGRMVIIYVGPNNQPWNVHEKLLIENSPYFARTLGALRVQNPAADQRLDGPASSPGHFGHGFGPANTPVPENNDALRLPDVDPKLFNMFLRWGYGTAFALSGNTRSFRFPPPSSEEGGATIRDYLGVYILGYKFETEALRNACVDVLYDYMGPASDDHMCLAMQDVAFVFQNTPSESPMRRFLVAHLLFYIFSRNRRAMPLPQEWGTVLEKGDFGISWTMFRMLGDWNWAIGDNVPVMIIKPRTEFHDKTPAQLQRIRALSSLGRGNGIPENGNGDGTNPVMIKREEGPAIIGQSGIPEAATPVHVLGDASQESLSQTERLSTPHSGNQGSQGPRVGPIRTARRNGDHRRGGPGGDHPATPYRLD
ncbi:hypothetical protein B0T21DRAFT_433138 [Apiosordaria backusii]|uniref:BTB domain-containing protein n=1 Tax=Apiosordaria backusii TaxID=314023 RepID=A0AA40ELZ0_9PEZI|nr:hypothetical protein B0T21DRAFT_433138 [Apiosordaria backusii]